VRRHLNPATLSEASVRQLLHELLHSVKLRGAFADAVEGAAASQDMVLPQGPDVGRAYNLVYTDIVSLYVALRIRELHREYGSRLFEQQDSDALRRRLKNAAKAAKAEKRFILDEGVLGQQGVAGVHRRLQGMLLVHGSTVLDASFNVPRLKLVWKAYNAGSPPPAVKKAKVSEALAEVILQCDDAAVIQGEYLVEAAAVAEGAVAPAGGGVADAGGEPSDAGAAAPAAVEEQHAGLVGDVVAPPAGALTHATSNGCAWPSTDVKSS